MNFPLPDVFQALFAILLVFLAFAALLAIVSRNIIKVPPNMVAVFSGRRRTIVDPATGGGAPSVTG